jgi:peptidoglycan/xylan/chitin deacetylase (PgdA/CDA1 family)
VNAAFKHAAELMLLRGGPADIARLGMGGRTLVLAYHNIVPDGERPIGERSLHLPQRRFAAQLDEVGRRCRVVPLSDIFAPGDGRPRVAITFDDAYLGAVTAGMAEVSRRGMPATIFVATECVGGHEFWWDALAGSAGTVDGDLRRRALDECRGLDAEVRARAVSSAAALRDDLPAYARTAGEQELRAVVARGEVTLGSHTARHPNLARLAPAELRAELTESRAWLERHFPGAAIPWLAYPYGSTSEAVRHAAKDTGYAGAFRVDGGWIARSPGSRYDLPRLNVSAGISLAGFALRLAGLFAR